MNNEKIILFEKREFDRELTKEEFSEIVNFWEEYDNKNE